MPDEKDDLPSDAEKSGLKPLPPEDVKPVPPPEDDKVEKDLSEQPS